MLRSEDVPACNLKAEIYELSHRIETTIPSGASQEKVNAYFWLAERLRLVSDEFINAIFANDHLE